MGTPHADDHSRWGIVATRIVIRIDLKFPLSNLGTDPPIILQFAPFDFSDPLIHNLAGAFDGQLILYERRAAQKSSCVKSE